MAADLDSVFFACREALPHLLKTKGTIINVSSASGLGGDWGLSSYNAAKGAITNFTRSLALEYGSRGVRVNAVAPSLTSTDATVDLEKSEAVMVAFRDRLPIGRRHVMLDYFYGSAMTWGRSNFAIAGYERSVK